MTMVYDVAIVGLGAVGAATAFHLARRGVRVIGFDKFDPPHEFGSSHGDTRITRLAIGEGDHLTPIVRRSHELWRAIESETGDSLLTQCGGLVISSDGTAAETHVKGFFRNTVGAAEKFGVAHEVMNGREIRSRFPQFAARNEESGYYEAEAGFVRPEACVRVQLALARQSGANLRTSERVLSFSESARGVEIVTAQARYRADRLILSAGAWLPQLAGADLSRLFKIYRQVMLWFDVSDAYEQFVPERFPIFIWEPQNTEHGIYGFPAIDGPHGGIKVASESFAVTTTPFDVDRAVARDEIAYVYNSLVAPHLRGVGAACVRSATCLYTVTPDFGFVIDTLPDSERVIIASPCSGHGFRHSPAIGEALADLVTGQTPRFDLSPFGLSRFG